MLLMHDPRGRSEDAKEKIAPCLQELGTSIGLNAVRVPGDFAMRKDQTFTRPCIGGHTLNGCDQDVSMSVNLHTN